MMALAATAGICTSIGRKLSSQPDTAVEDRLSHSWHEPDADRHGNRDERHGLGPHRRRTADLVGIAAHVAGGLPHPLALQLLATRQARSILLRLLAVYAFLIDKPEPFPQPLAVVHSIPNPAKSSV